MPARQAHVIVIIILLIISKKITSKTMLMVLVNMGVHPVYLMNVSSNLSEMVKREIWLLTYYRLDAVRKSHLLQACAVLTVPLLVTLNELKRSFRPCFAICEIVASVKKRLTEIHTVVGI